MNKQVYIYLFDGFSDWEIAYLTPEINKSSAFDLIFFSETGQKVTSMGGLNIMTKVALSDTNSDEIDALVLPGGSAWETMSMGPITELTKELYNKNTLIAAICAATTSLGQLGILDDIKHTSNDLNYLKSIADHYRGEDHYQDTMAITHKNVITANGVAPIEFARELFKEIKLYPETDIETWFQLFKNGVWSG